MAKTVPMFKINQMAKDLGMKTKELCAAIEEAGIKEKTSSSSLDPEEFNLFFEHMTSSNQIKNIDGYMTGATVIKTPDVVASEIGRAHV